MAIASLTPAPGSFVGCGLVPDGDIANAVRVLLANSFPSDRAIERRPAHRYPYPHLIVLSPVLPDGTLTAEAPTVACGKQISETGIGFFHPDPLPYRRVIASLETGASAWIGFLVDLHWCRFTRYGWYESGGRFLQKVASPLIAKKASA